MKQSSITLHSSGKVEIEIDGKLTFFGFPDEMSKTERIILSAELKKVAFFLDRIR